MKRRALRTALALLLLVPFSVVFMQDEAGVSLDIIGIDSTELSEIAIHVSILDSSEQLLSGLAVDNFSIGGDLAGLANISRVENITDDELAFATVLVIDTSSSMADQPLSEALAAARGYINALGPDDPVALMTFSDSARLIVNFTTDRALIFQQFENLAYGGQTALYDATLRAIEVANEAPLERKAVVILSDGSEYGNISEHSRQESIRAATIHGVPVYSIGLGWNIDQRFLEAIASESNGEFYNAPLPEELGAIFSNLAFLFRSQYIVTMSADVPADGRRYDFTLNVATSDGQRAAGRATLRAPIPVPLLFLPDDLFAEALTDDTQITVEIRADQDIESIEYTLDGEVVSTEETYTIVPVEQEPGEHQLDITVSDVEGDVGRLSAEFEIAALPPTVSDDFETAPQEDVAEAEVISVDAGGQTEITQVEFIVDGEVVKTDTEAPYEFDLDPFELLPEEHQLSIRATNAGGQVTTVEKSFEVEKLPPRLEIEGLTAETVVSDITTGSITVEGQSPIVSLSVEPDLGTLAGSNRFDFTLNAADLPPGRNTIAVHAVDEAGAETIETFEFEVAALAPTVEVSGVAVDALISGPEDVNVDAGGQTTITRIEVSYDGGPAEVVEDEVFTIPAEELGDGEHEALVAVTNEGGQTSTLRLPFTVQLPPTPTFTPPPTATATATHTATATDTAAPTATHTDMPVLTDTPSTESAQTARAIQQLTATDTAVPTDTPIPAFTEAPLPTNTEPPPTATPLPSETNTALPTDTPLPSETNTALPTDTPLPSETNTALPTETLLPTETATPVPTDTPLPTETDTPVPTDTPLPTETDTLEPTDTSIPTDTATPEPTDTPIPTDTNTPEPTDTPVPTETHTPLPTATPTDTPIPTDTPTDTPVPTDTPTDTPVPTATPTDTPVPTATPTDTPIPTATPTDTPVPTATPTDTPVPTATPTDTPIPTATPTDTPIPSDTPTDTPVPTATPTDTPVPTATPTDTPVPTATPTDTPVPSDTPTDTPVPTATPTDTPVPTATPTDTPVPTATPTDTPVPTATPTDTPIPTATPTDTPVPTATPTDTPIPTATPTDTPVPTATPTDTPIPTATPTDTPIPTATPTDTPVPTETPTDTPAPTDTPTATPTDTATPDVTATAAAESSLTAIAQSALDVEATSEAETETATAEATPTDTPTDEPTDEPTALPATATDAPTATAVIEPTAQPSLTPVTITEIEAPSADEPETQDTTLAIAAVVGGLLLLLLLFLLRRRR